MRRAPSVFLLVGALVAGLVAPSVASGPDAVPAVATASGPVAVEMRSLSYAPTKVTFDAPGRAVRWLNVTRPDRLHDVIGSLPGTFASELLRSGESYRYRFSAAGTFTYICSIHDVMLGRIEVAPVVEVVDGDAGPQLRITLGTASFAPDGDHRWAVFTRGPGDTRLRYRKMTRLATVALPADRAGDWTVMVRLRHRPTRTPSSDSPLVTVTVPD